MIDDVRLALLDGRDLVEDVLGCILLRLIDPFHEQLQGFGIGGVFREYFFQRDPGIPDFQDALFGESRQGGSVRGDDGFRRPAGIAGGEAKPARRQDENWSPGASRPTRTAPERSRRSR